ncbi:opioid growth factor receptor-like protein 1 [Scophthalmus maximus]|uniref:Opioid growth factor receptor like 1 n=1 Tax=Scophthalmus maximus TaxID=52904 RepID=A0A8D3AZS4_SCOMX|nr:opioid growth factor receptor-like protein 1 [Scophthalmus maximus]XP_035461750.1 opioid growth factor receptor-like protein 1 [Scophthalmus maximus]XP_035461751.1 opioid growth factor receptor-like protein 1 [Scophthalmus maximus]
MGNLLGSWRFKEPSTVEECDSTWGSDSESDEPAAEDDSGIADSVSPAEGERAPGAPGAPGDASPQLTDSPESLPKMKRSFYAARDLYKYRHSYPNFKRSRQPNEYRNLRFYLNKIPLVPDGIYIEEILSKWRGDYDNLEHNHTYIQWLFPLREQGLNFYAHELTQDEIKEFQSTREAKRRFLGAYSLMLDFYGIKLLDKSGNVARASNWQERFQHLNESQHNYLRITRILKSLGELGYEAFKAPLVHLFLQESLCHNTLPNMQHSVLEYYVYTIRLPATRRRLLRYARQHYRPAHAFLWGPPPKRRGGGVGAGGSVAAGSSGIRAPAPTPEQQRKEEESTTPTSPRSGIIVSSHDAVMCQVLAGGGPKGYAGLGSNMARLEGALMLAGARGGRNEYSEE